jgi:hypothetical protein
MKRHPALREFSGDHQELVNTLRLRRAATGAGGDPPEVARAFLRFWREQTEPHFRKEEEVLLPVLAPPAGRPSIGSLSSGCSSGTRVRGHAMRHRLRAARGLCLSAARLHDEQRRQGGLRSRPVRADLAGVPAEAAATELAAKVAIGTMAGFCFRT